MVRAPRKENELGRALILYLGAENNGSAGILVTQSSEWYAGRISCMLLGESLWNPDTQDFNDALNTSLAYQVYQGLATENQTYWIAKANETDDNCRVIDTQGAVHNLDCTSQVPTLCTQSAPVSNSSFANSSEAWHVAHFMGDFQVTGYRDYHTFKFRGIRYADPPERFGYSKLATYDESQTIDATTAGADCSQPIGEVKSGSSEDCLFANVWTPYIPPLAGVRSLKPVMLYYYGGGFTSGSGKNTNTDGTNLASRGDVVVVSVNYRVGSLGFLNFNDGVHKGNYAISDMVTALEWVNKYIQFFGGDPTRVTIFGESAGAQGTHILLGVPKAKGLFQRAIMQSGPDGFAREPKLTDYYQYDTLEQNFNSTTKRVLRDAGCLNATDYIGCLSGTSGFDIVNLTTNAK
jgi:hypothetical protein